MEEFLDWYPLPDTPGFQTLISSKEEYRELASLPSERISERGELYRSQRLVIRHMRIYDRILMMHEPGTGKTCGLGAIAEFFRKNNTTFKKACFITRGKTLIADIQRQIICKCSEPGAYDLTDIDLMSGATQKTAVTKMLGKWYEFYTYDGFAKYCRDMKDAELVEKLSNNIFFLDEAHNLRLTEAMIHRDASQEETESVIMKKKDIYYQLLRCFSSVKNAKVVVATATPMVNTVRELRPLMALLGRNIPDHINLETAGLKELEPYLRGIISYVRGADIGVVVNHMGDALPYVYTLSDGKEHPSQSKTWNTKMEEFQFSSYLRARSLRRGRGKPSESKGQDFHTNEKQAANFVFPDGSWGTEGPANDGTPGGSKKWIEINKSFYKATPLLQANISDLSKLRTMSCKYAEIVEMGLKGTLGTKFVYGDYLYGSGIIALALCLEAHGFERFYEVDSIFVSEGDKGGHPYCEASSKRRLRPPYDKKDGKKRYALISHPTPPPVRDVIFEAWNSKENMHGDLIKIMLSSPIGKDGINVNHATEIDIIESEWNESSIRQAQNRGIRATSHTDLIDEEKARLEALGRKDDKPIVEVDVYKHAAYGELDGDQISVDIDLYHLAEEKDIQIRRMERIMKQCSLDCQIHSQRNRMANRADFSAACDYDVCDYKCADPEPTDVDYSSYDVLYSEGIINDFASRIIKLMSVSHSWEIAKLLNTISDSNSARVSKFGLLAIDKLISKREVILDNFGYPCILATGGGMLFLVRQQPLTIKPDISDIYYTNTMIGRSISSLTEILSNYIDISPYAEDLAKGDYSRVLELDVDSLLKVAEPLLMSLLIGKSKEPAAVHLYERFGSLVFAVYKPVTELRKKELELISRGTKPGKEPGEKYEYNYNDPTDPNFIEEVQGPIIYFHMLRLRVKQAHAHNMWSLLENAVAKPRILDPTEGSGWRDPNSFMELYVYHRLAQRLIHRNIIRKIKAYPMTIYQLWDGREVILDNTISMDGKSRKYKLRGREIEKSLKKKDVYRYLAMSDLPPPGTPVDTTTPLQIVMATLQDKQVNVTGMDEKKLRLAYTWQRLDYKVDYQIGYLKQHIKQNGRYIIV